MAKQVTVMLELKARFDEEANLAWKERLEEDGVKVLIGIPNMKVHAKICVIRKRVADSIVQYGFISTGNLNEDTAKVYADHCLLTSNKSIMMDANRIFSYIEHYKTGTAFFKSLHYPFAIAIFCPKGNHPPHSHGSKKRTERPASHYLRQNEFAFR